MLKIATRNSSIVASLLFYAMQNVDLGQNNFNILTSESQKLSDKPDQTVPTRLDDG